MLSLWNTASSATRPTSAPLEETMQGARLWPWFEAQKLSGGGGVEKARSQWLLLVGVRCWARAWTRAGLGWVPHSSPLGQWRLGVARGWRFVVFVFFRLAMFRFLCSLPSLCFPLAFVGLVLCDNIGGCFGCTGKPCWRFSILRGVCEGGRGSVWGGCRCLS